jgi:DNA-binding NarL/FixJ family response regulator
VPKIRVVVAENHPAMLAQLCQQLGDDYEVVRTAEDGLEACEAVLELQPDVVLLDITMPIMDGLHAAQRLRQAKCGVKIILLSVCDDPDFIAAAFSAGADCYVAKSRLSIDLDPAIRTALQGNHFFSRSNGIVELSNGKL